MHLFYLHGFASSARSSKATFFAGKLREHGIDLQTPDFNLPEFSTLTVTRMVEQVVAAIDALPDAGEVALVGSSLGAFVAVQVALRRPDRVSRIVLLAPALEFNRLRTFAGHTLEEWQRSTRVDVFHFGYGRMLPVHYGLFEDACRYDCLDAPLHLPVQVFQGRLDTVVDPAAVERWARLRPNVELHLLDDDHQLTASVGYVWDEMRRFLGIGDRPPALQGPDGV